MRKDITLSVDAITPSSESGTDQLLYSWFEKNYELEDIVHDYALWLHDAYGLYLEIICYIEKEARKYNLLDLGNCFVCNCCCNISLYTPWDCMDSDSIVIIGFECQGKEYESSSALCHWKVAVDKMLGWTSYSIKESFKDLYFRAVSMLKKVKDAKNQVESQKLPKNSSWSHSEWWYDDIICKVDNEYEFLVHTCGFGKTDDEDDFLFTPKGDIIRYIVEQFSPYLTVFEYALYSPTYEITLKLIDTSSVKVTIQSHHIGQDISYINLYDTFTLDLNGRYKEQWKENLLLWMEDDYNELSLLCQQMNKIKDNLVSLSKRLKNTEGITLL